MSRHPLYTDYLRDDLRGHQREIEAALRKVLDSGRFILGGEVAAFEKEFADWLGVRHAIAVASGTDAIEVLLRGVGIGRGDTVAVPSHTAVACVSAITRAGAAPFLVDVDPAAFTITPEIMERVLRDRAEIRAVLAVHLYGQSADMPALQSLCDEHGVILLEDCAQAHGATWRGRKAGTLSRGAAFSFYPTKNLGALGDGGAITTNDDALAERLRGLREFGWRERYISAVEGVNSRLDELQAAVLRVKLRTLDSRNAARRRLAAVYGEALGAMKDVIVPVNLPEREHAFHLYVIRAKHRDALMKHLLHAGVPVGLHYPAAIHQQPAYAWLPHGSLAQTEALMPEILSLPLHPYLSDEAMRFTVDAIHRFPKP